MADKLVEKTKDETKRSGSSYAKFQFKFKQALFKMIFDKEKEWEREVDENKGKKVVNPKEAAKAA